MWFKSYSRNPFRAAAILDVLHLGPEGRWLQHPSLAKLFQYDLCQICRFYMNLREMTYLCA